MTVKCEKCSMNEQCICISSSDECFVRKQSYNKAIDEFAEKMKWEYDNSTGVPKKEIDFAKAVIDMVAERLKGGSEDV